MKGTKMIDKYDDIQIPVVYICDGWAVDDIETIEDCEDAYIKLVQICASIEAQIEDLTASGGFIGSAKAALRWKKLAMNLVNLKKARISRKAADEKQYSRDRLTIAFIATEDPDLMDRANKWADAAIVRRSVDGGN